MDLTLACLVYIKLRLEHGKCYFIRGCHNLDFTGPEPVRTSQPEVVLYLVANKKKDNKDIVSGNRSHVTKGDCISLLVCYVLQK